MRIVGVDPGLDGVMCWLFSPVLRPDQTEATDHDIPFGVGSSIGMPFATRPQIGFWKIPTLKMGTRRHYDVRAIEEKIRTMDYPPAKDSHFFIEKVQPMPKSMHGGQANFSMGYSAGMWEALLICHEVPYTLVSPVSWKRAMMPDMAKEKDSSRVRALQLFPFLSEELKRVKDHNRADSLLIAAFGARQLGINLNIGG